MKVMDFHYCRMGLGTLRSIHPIYGLQDSNQSWIHNTECRAFELVADCVQTENCQYLLNSYGRYP